jgi:hypothetical protein
MERRYGDRVPEVSHCSKKGVIARRTENGFSLPWRGGQMNQQFSWNAMQWFRLSGIATPTDEA